jgi:hypothetical protein
MMHQRCKNPRHRSYAEYGGRGISVDPSWSTFDQFLKDMGPRPSSSHSLDRVDANGNYGPLIVDEEGKPVGGCRWATVTEQNRNKRFSWYLPHPETGEIIPAGAVAEFLGMDYRSMRQKYLLEGKWINHNPHLKRPMVSTSTPSGSVADQTNNEKPCESEGSGPE